MTGVGAAAVTSPPLRLTTSSLAVAPTLLLHAEVPMTFNALAKFELEDDILNSLKM